MRFIADDFVEILMFAGKELVIVRKVTGNRSMYGKHMQKELRHYFQ